MKAFIRYRYGNTTELNLVTLPVPTPSANEVCVKINATSLNASDWEFLTGRPAYTRIWGIKKPRVTILGSDISGTILSVGSDVTHYSPGDAVFGDVMEYWGGFGEYAVVAASMLTAKPTSLTHIAAASLPQSACVAWQGIDKLGPIVKGQSILINGAGGGSGSFAIQFAKRLGAKVTAVDRSDKFEHMIAMGADHVVDYLSENYCHQHNTYDAILDFVASHSVFENRKALKTSGKYFVVGGKIGNILKTLIFGFLFSLIGTKKMRVLAAQPNKHLDEITALVLCNELVVPIDQMFEFKNIPEAMDYLGQGKAKGKVVINIASQTIE